MHIIRAADLANGLAGASIEGIGKVERIVGTEAKDFYGKLYGRTGIIFIHAYWLRQGETTPSGDHIDVWNGYRSSTKWLMECLLARLLFQVRESQGGVVLGREVAARLAPASEQAPCAISLPCWSPSRWPRSSPCS
jgi:hypothetical protein